MSFEDCSNNAIGLESGSKRGGKHVVVVVIGGAGFLGHHLIQHLQLYDPSTELIRVLDYMPYYQLLEYHPRIPVFSITGSVTSSLDVAAAIKGARTVYHMASVIDTSMFVEKQFLWENNVEGTKTVVDMCIENGVRNLIYISCASVVMGREKIVFGTEEMTSYPKVHLFEYAATICEAEKIVLQAHGEKTYRGNETLHTLSLRPVSIFGELDHCCIASAFDLALSNKGQLICLGDMQSRSQIVYAGNVAWAILCAENALETWEESGGKAYFIIDRMPAQNLFYLIRPFLNRYGFFLTSWALPKRIADFILNVFKVIVYLLYPLLNYNPHFSKEMVHSLCTTYTFSGKLARQMLAYAPIYSPEKSKNNVFKFYDLKFKKAAFSFVKQKVMQDTEHTGVYQKLGAHKKTLQLVDLGAKRKK